MAVSNLGSLLCSIGPKDLQGTGTYHQNRDSSSKPSRKYADLRSLVQVNQGNEVIQGRVFVIERLLSFAGAMHCMLHEHGNPP